VVVFDLTLACIVSACGAPFGLGSDIGGSLRMPGFFCGVFAHKPTGGLIPNTGQFPIARNEGKKDLFFYYFFDYCVGLKYMTTGGDFESLLVSDVV